VYWQSVKEFLKPNAIKILIFAILLIDGVLGFSLCLVRTSLGGPDRLDYPVFAGFPICLVTSIPYLPLIAWDNLVSGGLIIDEGVSHVLILTVIPAIYSYFLSCIISYAWNKIKHEK
jgi:hypothetical protein